MSDSDENFDLDVSGSESDGFVPTKKKATKAPAKKTATKAAPKAAAKPKATKKTKVLADRDDNADSDDDDQGEDPASVAGPSAPKETNGKKKTASETYTKVRSTRKDACMRSVTPLHSSPNLSTSSNDPIRTLEAWRRSPRPCGHGTQRTSGWFIGRSSTFQGSSRLWTKFS